MNARIIASILKRIAKEIFTFDMTEEEWENYHKEHPGAKRWNHHIIHVPEKRKFKDKELRKQNLIQRMKAKKDYFKRMKKEHPNYEPILDKKDFQNMLYRGEYSCISAGVNGDDPEDVLKAKKDRDFIRKRTNQLRRDLDDLGVKYTEITGSYGAGEEPSFLISHTVDAKASETQPSNMLLVGGNSYSNDKNIIEKLNKLGEKYNQNSVGHVKDGKMEIHYTTGPNKGKRALGKSTVLSSKDQDDFFSEARLGEEEYTKWSCNIDWDNIQENPYFQNW